jgi:hypothetical protein
MTTASASYSNPEGGSASAFATIGSTPNGGLTLKAFATGTAGDVVSNRGSADLSWYDDIHVSGTLLDLLIDLEFKITGSVSGDGLMSGASSYCVGSTCSTPIELDGPGTIRYRVKELNPSSTVFELHLSLSATASGVFSGPTSSTADFSHSFDLVSIRPLDSNGNIVRDVTFTSDSGFDYNAVVVPEPSALLLAICAAALGIRRR